MEGGGSGSVVLPLKKNINIKSVYTQLQTKWGELEKGFQGWVCKQPVLVETAAVAATYALQGAVVGLLYGSLAQSAANSYLPFEEFGKTRLLQVRNFSVLRGTDGAVISAMRRIRGGKDDTKARAVAAFTSGFMFQVVSNIPSPSTPEAIATGLLFAVCHGLAHEVLVRSNSSQPPVENTCYTRARCIDLVMAGIPLGPRTLILNHIKRDPDLIKTQGS
ncbi:hypothetical protein C5167_000456 [Papaver somniferum]|uniref:Uncharacterized protein n=1 Tax=Papaver somniferum TaxID=3469 RepID=A0A4Y7KSJ3_PAPSO|nr:hypothetical protein C5167_000456 [Papaver somniferum]